MLQLTVGSFLFSPICFSGQGPGRGGESYQCESFLLFCCSFETGDRKINCYFWFSTFCRLIISFFFAFGGERESGFSEITCCCLIIIATLMWRIWIRFSMSRPSRNLWLTNYTALWSNALLVLLLVLQPFFPASIERTYSTVNATFISLFIECVDFYCRVHEASGF